jgi:hypothetical protein
VSFTPHLEEAFAAAKDRRNGQNSEVERRSLNPAPSFLEPTLSARFCERIEGCGKKVE